MIKHIVMFKLKEGVPDKQLAILKDKIDRLKNQIPQIKYLETGLNISNSSSAFDLVLVSEFENNADLDAYRVHPDHLDVLSYLKEIVSKLNVVDYKI